MNNFEVLSYLGNSLEIESVKRLSDKTVFKIGDRITNGLVYNGNKVNGIISKFDYVLKCDEIFVKHDWNGVGWNLDSLSHFQELPKLRYGDLVDVVFTKQNVFKGCRIIKIHEANNSVTYDVQAYVGTGVEEPEDAIESVRLYNISSKFIKN